MHDNILSNSEINHLISKTFNSSKDQSIVRDRIINGYTFEKILSNHFPDAVLSGKTRNRFILHNIIPLLNKYYQNKSLLS